MFKSVVGGLTFVLLVFVVACSNAGSDMPRAPGDGNEEYKFTVNKRLYTFNKNLTRWFDALENCLAAGAQLFTPETDVEAKDLLIVLNRLDTNVTWTGIQGLDDGSNTYVSQDGRFLSSSAVWAAGQPDSKDGDRQCVALTTGPALTLLPCYLAVAPYVCQSPAKAPPVGIKLLDDKSRRHVQVTFKVNQRTYTYHWDFTTWSKARERCSATGAQLIIPESAFEAKAVLVMVNPPIYTPVWTGTFLQENSSDTFVTLDGTIADFSPYWAPGQPNLDGGRRRCVGLLDGPKFTVLPCNSTDAYYVCKSPAPAQPAESDTELLKAGHFESLVENEIRRLPQEKQLQIMASILRVIKEQANKPERALEQLAISINN